MIKADEYAFFGCEDLLSVSICDNTDTDNEIRIDDDAFRYCERLGTVLIGNGVVTIGEYVFTGCGDDLRVSVAEQSYMADMIRNRLEQ